MPSMPAMPSLSNLGTLTSTPKAPQPKPVEEEQPKEMRSNPFTVDQLRNAWVGQVRRFPREERLKAMLLNYEIEMDSDTEFHITLDNVLQRKEFQRFGKDIMDDIRNRLQNDHIQLRVQVSDYVRHTRAYTSSDKFKLLNELNPHLMELRDTLHMLLD